MKCTVRLNGPADKKQIDKLKSVFSSLKEKQDKSVRTLERKYSALRPSEIGDNLFFNRIMHWSIGSTPHHIFNPYLPQFYPFMHLVPMDCRAVLLEEYEKFIRSRMKIWMLSSLLKDVHGLPVEFAKHLGYLSKPVEETGIAYISLYLSFMKLSDGVSYLPQVVGAEVSFIDDSTEQFNFGENDWASINNVHQFRIDPNNNGDIIITERYIDDNHFELIFASTDDPHFNYTLSCEGSFMLIPSPDLIDNLLNNFAVANMVYEEDKIRMDYIHVQRR